MVNKNYCIIIILKAVKYMKLRDGIMLVGAGALGTIMYEQIKQGKFKKMMSKVTKTKKKMMNDLEEMM